MANNADSAEASQAFQQNWIKMFQSANARLDEITGRLQEVQREIHVDRDRAYARAVNLNMARSKTHLVALPREDGELPSGFPETYQAFKNLDGEQVDALLDAYKQPIHGSAEDRRLRLACFIGMDYIV
ncbi:hypothetical protein FRC08_015662 [Ceratobasidium sp. 394]|nr:hypothetical protein FRC08_015662 [Ceratobasidium sp. 394]